MNPLIYNPQNPRVFKANLARRINLKLLGAVHAIALGILVLSSLLVISAFIGIFMADLGSLLPILKLGVILLGASLGLWVLCYWIRGDILSLAPADLGQQTDLATLLPATMLTRYSTAATPLDIFTSAANTWEGAFVLNRLQLSFPACQQALATWQIPQHDIWMKAREVALSSSQATLSGANIIAAMFQLSPQLQALLTERSLGLSDVDSVMKWSINLDRLIHAKKPSYGGFARDWASGFTPTLSRFGQNLSIQIENSGKYFELNERTTQLDTLIEALGSSTGSVVLIGEPGVGKSALLLGLADRILQGVASGSLAHHQIISLDASRILAETSGGGTNIEQVMLSLINEAGHAGNIVLAFDEAQLFFGQGAGAVNLSQVLLPVLQSRSLRIVFGVTPGDWQKLRANNAALTSLLTPLVLAEPNEAATIEILAGRALILERPDAPLAYSALTQSYRLSGRYLQDEAYPGKALKVLEASLVHPDNGVITSHSVEQAIESQFGVKVASATGAESDVLLHLEDKIHERMINQTRAVHVVASALRRARAGVSNPKRPIGSFLFLGPTGVGKTELAKSIAALYFGAEDNMIRLDMSEYQQPTDELRLLESAAENSQALLSKIRTTPFSVVLFDEIEKAHPNILNLFLQLLDEGSLSDDQGRPASFKDAIIIATSNAGAEDIRTRIEAGEPLESFETQLTNDLISSGQFKPELLNRFDEIVLFRPLTPLELTQVVRIMIAEVNRTLAVQKITVSLTEAAITTLVEQGYDPRLGARPMRRMVTRRVEDAVANRILAKSAIPGDTITLDVGDVAGDKLA